MTLRDGWDASTDTPPRKRQTLLAVPWEVCILTSSAAAEAQSCPSRTGHVISRDLDRLIVSDSTLEQELECGVFSDHSGLVSVAWGSTGFSDVCMTNLYKSQMSTLLLVLSTAIINYTLESVQGPTATRAVVLVEV